MEHVRRAATATVQKHLLSAAIALLLQAPLAHAEPEATAPMSRDEASFQLALTIKIRADQTFLLGDRAQAKQLYRDAAAELQSLDVVWKSSNDVQLSLLAADIAYRQALLAYDADFWGAAYSLVPINPVEAYLRFAEDVTRFRGLVTRIEDEERRLASSAALEETWHAAAEGAKTDADVQALNQIAEEIQQTHHAAKATAAQDRITNNIERQKEIADERSQLAARYDAAHKKFDSMVVNAVLASAGVPPELKELAASDKPLEQRILSAGRAALASNSALANSFRELSETTAAVVDAARKVDQAVSEVQRLEQIRRSSTAAVAALRRGSIEGALEAGRIVYAQLPAADQAKLAGYVSKELKPAAALFDSARQVQSTLETVVRVVRQDPAMFERVKQIVTERALDNAPAFDRWYRQQLSLAAQAGLTAESGQVLMEQVIRAWPAAFVAALPAEFQRQLREVQQAASVEAAAAKTFATWPPVGGLKLTLHGDEIRATLGGITASPVSLAGFLASQRKSSIEALRNYAEEAAHGEEAARLALQQKLGALAQAGLAAQGTFADRLVGSLPELDVSAALSRLVPVDADGKPDPQASARIFNQVWQQLPEPAQRATATELAQVQAGSLLGADIVAATLRRPAGNPAARATGAPGAAQEAILKAAVAAAFPAAGVALMAADAVSAMGEMNSLANQINTLTAEDRRIMAEQITLFDLLRDEQAASALAALGIQMAERRRIGALAQADGYRAAAQHLDDAAKKSVGAQRLYLPRTLLMAEQLRLEFDRLDRSLAFWTGDPRAPRGQIARELTADPQWLRYALDPSIRLYSWLDRAGESDRGQLDRLAAEWEQKLAIAGMVCDKLQCKQANAVVGEVTASPEISIKNVAPAQWQRYLQWRVAGSGEFVFEFLVTPTLLKLDRKMHNIRYVAARVGVQRRGTVRGVQGANLTHSGAAYVPYEDTYIKEHYVPRTAYGVSWEPFGDMRTRWQNALTLRPLEGYGVYTLWRLVLPDSSEARQAEDVKLQFNLQFQERQRVPDDRQLRAEDTRKKAWTFVFKTADQLPVSVSLADLPFMGSEEAARRTFAALAAEAKAIPLGFGNAQLIEEQGAAQ